MKIAQILVLLYIALIGIVIFDGLIVSGMGWGAIPYGSGEDQESNAFWNMFTNPFSWTNSVLMRSLTLLFLTSAAASLAVAYVTKSDIALLTPLFVLLLNAGILPIIAIATVVYREVFRMVCTGTLNSVDPLVSCSQNNTIAAILITAAAVGWIAIIWIFVCVEWWTQRPTS